jgi:CreA protein
MTRKAIVAVAGGLLVAVASAVWVTAEQAAPKIGFKPELLIQLDVASLDRSIEFYTKKLGFKLTERRDDLKFAHIATSVPGVQIGLGEVASPQPKGVVLNFDVTNADAGRRALEAAGVVFQGETLLIPGKVKLAGFLDPDGHRLRLAGPAK